MKRRGRTFLSKFFGPSAEEETLRAKWETAWGPLRAPIIEWSYEAGRHGAPHRIYGRFPFSEIYYLVSTDGRGWRVTYGRDGDLRLVASEGTAAAAAAKIHQHLDDGRYRLARFVLIASPPGSAAERYEYRSDLKTNDDLEILLRRVRTDGHEFWSAFALANSQIVHVCDGARDEVLVVVSKQLDRENRGVIGGYFLGGSELEQELSWTLDESFGLAFASLDLGPGRGSFWMTYEGQNEHVLSYRSPGGEIRILTRGAGMRLMQLVNRILVLEEGGFDEDRLSVYFTSAREDPDEEESEASAVASSASRMYVPAQQEWSEVAEEDDDLDEEEFEYVERDDEHSEAEELDEMEPERDESERERSEAYAQLRAEIVRALASCDDESIDEDDVEPTPAEVSSRPAAAASKPDCDASTGEEGSFGTGIQNARTKSQIRTLGARRVIENLIEGLPGGKPGATTARVFLNGILVAAERGLSDIEGSKKSIRETFNKSGLVEDRMSERAFRDAYRLVQDAAPWLVEKVRTRVEIVRVSRLRGEW